MSTERPSRREEASKDEHRPVGVTLAHVLERAVASRKAVAAVNVNDMNDVRAVAAAAEARQVPVVLSLSDRAIKCAGLDRLVALIGVEQNRCRVPVFVQRDHATSLEAIEEASRTGVDALMVDGSARPFGENLRFVKQARTRVRSGVIEAQVGVLADGRNKLLELKYTEPEEAAELVQEGGADCISVSFGNVHDYFLEAESYSFRLDVLDSVRRRLPRVPLVMHGADNVPAAQITDCIKAGINKVNIGPILRQRYLEELGRATALECTDPRRVMSHATNGMRLFLTDWFDQLGEALWRF